MSKLPQLEKAGTAPTGIDRSGLGLRPVARVGASVRSSIVEAAVTSQELRIPFESAKANGIQKVYYSTVNFPAGIIYHRTGNMRILSKVQKMNGGLMRALSRESL
jgi:hypothetical protein